MAPAALSLTSTAFGEGDPIPRRCTCEGSDVSPPLAWSGVPPDARSLALVVHDPDAPDPRAPKRDWVHWIVYDIPPTAEGLAEGGPLPAGAREGQSDGGGRGYHGPCPPVGRHRYLHELYALDQLLGDLGRPTRAQLEKAMEGHVKARGVLVGTYEKGQP